MKTLLSKLGRFIRSHVPLVAAGALIGSVAVAGGLGGGGLGGAPGFTGGDVTATSGTFSGNVVPSAQLTYTLGTASLRWNSVFAQTLADSSSSNRLSFGSASTANLYIGRAANSSTNYDHVFATGVAKTNTGAGPAKFCAENNQATSCTAVSTINKSGFYLTPAQAVTVADDGAGTAATNTLTPTSQSVRYTCNDANGCAITLSESEGVDGAEVRIVNVSANAITFADSSGVSETTGALSLGQWDSVVFEYVTDRWVQMTAVVNN